MEMRRTILVADDAAMFRELGSIFLARTGRVITANDGAESLDAVRRERPSVVVADLDMPSMGGDELCRRLKATPDFRDVPVILVTGTASAEDRARAVRAGADDVIAKPISRMTLIQAVNRFLRGQPVRGLVRVPLETDVRIVHGELERRGAARNVSRGGIFVETPSDIPLATEVALTFALPETKAHLSPTAQVVWRRDPSAGRLPGVGLQFLALDRISADRIESFVYERAPSESLAGTSGTAPEGGSQ